MTKTLAIIAAALLAGGCASTYHLTLMPRDSGKTYQGVAEDTGSGTEGSISITIEGRTYTGTWVEVVSGRSYGYVAGYGGRHRGFGLGGIVTMDNPYGSQATALLRAADGAGLRCELRGGGGQPGGGVCHDDKGLAYDVQMRVAPRR